MLQLQVDKLIAQNTVQQWSVFPFVLLFAVYIQYLCLILCVFKGPCARCVVEIVLKLESEHC